MSDGTSSEKAGGFSLDKNFDFSSHDIGKIECQVHRNEDCIGRIAFYDRDDNLVVEIKPNTGLSETIKTVKLEEDEKFCGFEAHHNSNVVYGFGVKIAKGKMSKTVDSYNAASLMNIDVVA
jgi:hypothetical protein